MSQTVICNQNNALEHFDNLIQLLSGMYVSKAIYVAAKLGIADLLKDGAKSSDELAKATEVDAQFLYRLLRALASVNIFIEVGDRYFELTPLATYLQIDAFGSMRSMALAMGEDWNWQCLGNLFNAIKTGIPAFEHQFGMSMFDYFVEHPELGKNYYQAMTDYSEIINHAILDVYDFPTISKLVDVGGGYGALFTAILKANPAITGILFDLPSVIERAKKADFFHNKELAGRYELVGGDFFESVPSGGDIYIIKLAIHNWDDHRANKILQNCYQAMPPNGKLLVIEPVVPSGNERYFGVKLMDLQMLIGTDGGRERTADEFEKLFIEAGFRLTKVIPTKSSCSIVEGVKI
ncbi:acetylserotonin O-methyltransferase [Nostoc sp. XA010]|uniref:acetylserotonin O-methyltransferase n=1 Tax=Nostoc sp. XA010 TaxID=2780407 RepID=UPI001E40B4E1|nr:acetylserotonin O-methyltransferase [Nostoc sp. XA010]MCC5661240.1 acetylserotonin O-methyltransferase [Nostoc sp. XA010]